jgi:hypothetical protein
MLKSLKILLLLPVPLLNWKGETAPFLLTLTFQNFLILFVLQISDKYQLFSLVFLFIKSFILFIFRNLTPIKIQDALSGSHVFFFKPIFQRSMSLTEIFFNLFLTYFFLLFFIFLIILQLPPFEYVLIQNGCRNYPNSHNPYVYI